MKLYHCPKTRSVRPLWLMEELGIPYQLETINVFEGAGQTPEYLAINPGGSVPTLDDNGCIIYEAGAICQYLTELHPEKKLAPTINSPLRAHYLQWMFYVPATMELPLVNIFLHTMLLEESQRRPAVVEDSKQRYQKIAAVLEQAITDKAYILGDEFSTADIMIATTLLWIPDLLDGFEQLQLYTQRLLTRPAFQKARSL